MRSGYENILLPKDLQLPVKFNLDSNISKLALEIGFGNGDYTVKFASENLDTLVIGMEVSFSCLTRCARKTAMLSNLKLLRADARFMMKELFEDESLDMVIMNFPCPWPKTRHAKRRVTAKEFADSLAAVLKTGGIFELVTDEEWYAAEVQKSLASHGALSVLKYETNFLRPVTTKYERKWLDMGKTITRLSVTKIKKFTVLRHTWEFYNNKNKYNNQENNKESSKEGNVAMHIKINKSLPENNFASFFSDLLRAHGVLENSRWVFNSYYVSNSADNLNNLDYNKNKKFLVETITSDDEFEQRFYFKIVERDGNTLVKLDGTAKVFLTPAVRFAMEDLAKRLFN